MSVTFAWTGAPTTSSLQMVVVLDAAATTLQVVATSWVDSSQTLSSVTAAPAAGPYRVTVSGLQPNTRYSLMARVDGSDWAVNACNARTLPATRAPLRITFGSCWAATGQQYHGVENHPVGAAVAAQHDSNGATMHLFCGDMGYLDDQISDPNPWADNFPKLNAMPYFAQMAQSCAWASVWDDHDFGGNDSNGTFANKALAASTWRQYVPSYPLPVTDAIYHAFNLTPDVRVVMSDLRYFRDPDTIADSATKTMMGAAQKTWLKQQWLDAKNAGQLIVWVTSSMWCIDGPDSNIGTNADDDGWWDYTYERRELDDYRAANGITDFVILTGDGHQISYRNRADYSDAKGVAAPTYASAAYSRRPAFRSALWDQTSTANEADGHYAVLNITPLPLRGWAINCEFHRVDVVDGTDRIAFTSATQYQGVSELRSPGNNLVSIGGVTSLVGS